MPVPRQIGRYEVLEAIGRGGMGVVYKARDPALERVVAVKVMGGAVLLAEALRDEYLARFQREARAAARLSHPHIVPVHDFGVDGDSGEPFLVMEYVAGASLGAALREDAPFPLEQALDILDQVASALAEAHAAGVVHRDIKPENILIDARGRVRVADFGIARVEGSELTQTGVGMGTPGYLPPEVLRGAPADARADVFALGALGYHLLTGRKAFAGNTRDAIALLVVSHQPEPPHLLRPEIPPAVSAAVMHALAKAPEERTPSANAFRDELRGVGGTVTVSVPVPGAGPGPAARRFVRPAAIVLALLLAAALVPWSLRSCREEAPRVEASAPPATPRPKASARNVPVTVTTIVVPPPRRDRDEEDDQGHPGRGKGRGHQKKKKER